MTGWMPKVRDSSIAKSENEEGGSLHIGKLRAPNMNRMMKGSKTDFEKAHRLKVGNGLEYKGRQRLGSWP